MLDAKDLKDIIINAISKKEDANQVHNIIATQINLYLIQNLEIQGNYVGQIPSAPPLPDPMNGPVKFRLAICLVLGKQLLNFAKQSMDLWYKALTLNIQLTSVLLPAGDKVNLTVPCPPFMPISSSSLNLKDSKDLEETWLTITDTLVNDIKSTSPVPAPIPAISNAGGVGVVTLTKFN